MGGRTRASSTSNAEWTVMVYMAAARDEQTERAAIADLRELEKVGSTPKVNIVVQLDRQWPAAPQLFRVENSQSVLEPDPPPGPATFVAAPRVAGDLAGTSLTPLTMSTGDPEPLRHFIRWVRQYRRAKRYLLVLWGHNYGLGFGRDPADPLTMPELSWALTVDGMEQRWVDLLGVNSCAMSYAEAAFELRDVAKYLLASEITMPFRGWPYAEILDELTRNPTMPARELGSLIIDRFMNSYERRKVALTLLDLSKAEPLKDGINGLAAALIGALEVNNPSDERPLRTQIVDAFLDTAHGAVRPLIDLKDLCDNLTQVTDPGVKQAATTLSTHITRNGSGRGLVVHHDTDPKFRALHGIGVFAPAVTSEADVTRLDLSHRHYDELALAHGTDSRGWASFVYKNLRELLEPVHERIAEFVAGSGATSREDRPGVAQLWMSVDRAFRKVEVISQDLRKQIDAFGPAPRPAPRASSKTKRAEAEARPTFLRLLERRRHREAAVRETLWTSTLVGTTPTEEGAPLGGETRILAERLHQAEKALATLEQTARDVVTHETLGLGEPFFRAAGSGDPFKPSGGLGAEPFDPFKPSGGLGAEPFDPFKPSGGLGADPFKPSGGLGDPFKPSGGLGLLPWMFAPSEREGAAASSTTTLAQLYALVAESFSALEEGLLALEQVAVAKGVLDLKIGDERRKAAIDDVRRALSALDELIANARRTVFSVLAHPAYGLGPGPMTGLGLDGPLELAAASGLSPRVLQLL